MDKFDNCAIQQIPRYENDKADALSKFGATMAGIKDRRITTIIRDKTVITESLNVEMHLKTQIVAKGSWVEELPGVLWAYRTTLQTATGETPFCLVYETEAIIHIKMGEESQRVMTYDSETNQDERSFDLITIEERRDMAYARIMHHKGMMMKNYNRKVKPRQLQVEDLVLKIVEVTCHVGKLDPAWEGPYKVIEIKKRGTYKLKDMQRQKLPRPYNIHNLKKFYA
ncbi:uncharacterized protein LOC105171275 [Sesamum indicum]|uniref:Uncharacterized protein LOC105171275 n=1 Tax=Sesamum indicum TaxID=4182 RepID=A0A6I9U9K6_SESIN|nr:uncharacterized protein LOC105171275 [Sesamum indicum]